MPVFISHRTADDALAERIKNRLTTVHRIECWIDGIGPSSPNETITREVLAGLDRCTHLIAVVTQNTAGSWWVPFEIGVAQHGERAITSYSSLGRSSMPEYLWQWPVINGDPAIDQFAAIYKKEKIVVENFSRTGKVASASTSGLQSSAKTFHSELKRLLGQQ